MMVYYQVICKNTEVLQNATNTEFLRIEYRIECRIA